MELTMEVDRLAGWVPIRLYWQRSRPVVDWCYLGERRFREPFFDQTIEQCFRHPFCVLFRHQTPLDTLAELQAARPGLPPSGFIFHMSRCGSTLIAQMLAALPQNIVIAEASPIDSVLRARFRASGLTDEQRLAWLRWMVGALGQRRHEQERHLFIKFDSWNAIDLPLIRRAFPGVPWIFVYRDPVEVMASHLRLRGSQMLFGVLEPELLDLDAAAIPRMPLDEYCARVLARICDSVVRHYEDGGGLLVHYRQLPEAVWSSLLGFFQVARTAGDVERMRDVSRFHAKTPSLPFVDDTAAKQREATDMVRLMADRWVRPLYERLEALRRAQTMPCD